MFPIHDISTAIIEEPGTVHLPELSVVIIARNEARNIARTIQSVLRMVENHHGMEILLVDSASTDDTVEIAKGYPISIVRLRPDWYLSASAGRYIGTGCTRGKFILYLDGDMELDFNWLSLAIPYATDHPEIGVIGGSLRYVYIRNDQIIGEKDFYQDPEDKVLEVPFIGGAMLCRRSAVLEIGGFQPFISGDEEVEFCMRIRQAGYKVIRLPHRICRHYCIPPDSLSGTLRRIRQNMWLGYGQVARQHLGGPLFWTYVSQRGAFVVPLVGFLITMIVLVTTLISKNILLIGSWCSLTFFLLLATAIRKHSMKSALQSFLMRILITYGALRGFMMYPRPTSEYPMDPEIVQIIN